MPNQPPKPAFMSYVHLRGGPVHPDSGLHWQRWMQRMMRRPNSGWCSTSLKPLVRASSLTCLTTPNPSPPSPGRISTTCWSATSLQTPATHSAGTMRYWSTLQLTINKSTEIIYFKVTLYFKVSLVLTSAVKRLIAINRIQNKCFVT